MTGDAWMRVIFALLILGAFGLLFGFMLGRVVDTLKNNRRHDEQVEQLGRLGGPHPESHAEWDD